MCVCGGGGGNAVPYHTISGKWLIGCSSEAQQSKLARLETLPGGVPIGARVPRPAVDGVVGPIPKGGNELQLVRQDL